MTNTEAFKKTIQKAKDFRDGKLSHWTGNDCAFCRTGNICRKCVVTNACRGMKNSSDHFDYENSILFQLKHCDSYKKAGNRALKYLYTRRARLKKQGKL